MGIHQGIHQRGLAMKTFSHKRPVRDVDGQVIGMKPASAVRVTRAQLGGEFGTDSERRLVVSLVDGDLIEFRPERTRQVKRMAATDLYRCVLRCEVNRVLLERASDAKRRKADARADRKWRNLIRREAE